MHYQIKSIKSKMNCNILVTKMKLKLVRAVWLAQRMNTYSF